MAEFHVYSNGVDIVVAQSTEDAARAACEIMGYEKEEIDPFARIPDDMMIEIGFEDSEDSFESALFEGVEILKPPDNRRYWSFKARMPASEWARRNGRGVIASTEW